MESDSVIREALGEEFVTAYGAMRRHELQRFDDHVTDWEREEYVEVFSAAPFRSSSPASTTPCSRTPGGRWCELLERLGREVEFPEEQTCCGQMHANTGYPREALPLVRALRRTCSRGYEAVVSPSASCVGMVREHYRRARRREPPARCYRADRVPRRRAGRRATSARASPTASPTTRPATRCALLQPRRRAAAAAARRARARARRARRTPTSAAASAARSRSRTPTPRRRCWPTSCAPCSTPAPRSCAAADNSCLMHIGGGLRAPADRRAARCTWPRSWRRRETSRARRAFPAPAARRRCADAQLRAQPGHAPRRRSAASAPRVGRRAAGLGGAARGGRGDQGRARCATSTGSSSELEARGHARPAATVHWARDAAEANAIVAGSRAAPARDEVIKVKSLATDEIGLNEALAAAGIDGASRPTWPS